MLTHELVHSPPGRKSAFVVYREPFLRHLDLDRHMRRILVMDNRIKHSLPYRRLWIRGRLCADYAPENNGLTVYLVIRVLTT